MIKLNVGYTENNIITIALMHLTGSAFNYFSDLTEKPFTWSAFNIKLIERLKSQKLNKTQLMLKILKNRTKTKTQEHL
ncbi:hypothetical protein GVAV_001988 [Gurleya vavrai]